MGAGPDDEKILKVGNTSSANSLASAISHGIYDGHDVYLRAIGAGAVNQTVKAIAIARGFVGPRGIDLHCIPGFATVKGRDDQDISAMLFKVFGA